MAKEQEKTGSSQERGRRRNYFSKRQMQGRLLFKIVAMVLLAVFVSISVTSVLYYKYSNQEFKGDVPFYYIYEGTPQEREKLPTAFDVLFPGLMVCGFFMCCFTIVAGVLVSHRIGGPITNIQRIVSEVSKGNLCVPVKLRKGDEFQDLAGELQEMVDNVRSQVRMVQAEVVRLNAHPDLGRFHDLEEGLRKIAAELKYFKTE